jgi:O-acetyl-ADP-ribose deacetylase (regulator of RNase III)
MNVHFNLSDEIIKTKDDAIAHGCNTKGVMGKGAAFTMKHMCNINKFVFNPFLLD